MTSFGMHYIKKGVAKLRLDGGWEAEQDRSAHCRRLLAQQGHNVVFDH